MVSKIISGGQTGADRGGLLAAIDLGIPHGGYCPKGRKAEDGRIPDRFQMTESNSVSYPYRTKHNVREADATIVFSWEPLQKGSLLTVNTALKLHKPIHLVVLANLIGNFPNLRDFEKREVLGWFRLVTPTTLNVAGSRESRAVGTEQLVRQFLVEVLEDWRQS